MQFDERDMEVIVLATPRTPTLTPSEQAHVNAIRERCRTLKAARCGSGGRQRVLRRLLWACVAAALLVVGAALF